MESSSPNYRCNSVLNETSLKYIIEQSKPQSDEFLYLLFGVISDKNRIKYLHLYFNVLFFYYKSYINILIGGIEMARGKKNLTLEEQLTKISAKIETMENSLKELKKIKKELEDKIKMNRLSELDDLIISSGKSFEEVKAILSSENK